VKLSLVFFIFCLFTLESAKAQVQVEQIYNETIHTVLLYNAKQEQSFPAIALKSVEKLILKFDDLASQFSTYTYTIEHCAADWTLSPITTMEYMKGYNHNFISNYRFSSNTLQPYAHYQLEIPNADVQPLLSGNYILKVFNANNDQEPVFSRRFVVYQQAVQIQEQLRRSTTINDRNKKQKIDFSILHNEYRIDNPFDQLRVWVLQNESWENALFNKKPSFFDDRRLVYDYVDANLFDGNSEHRRFDIRSTRFLAEGMARIEAEEEQWDVYLREDFTKSPLRFVENQDLNGKFYIDRTDMNYSDINGDYVFVHFTYDYGSQNPLGDFYVLGAFNQWKANEQSLLQYDLKTRKYVGTVYLKQGIYDYMIGFKSKKYGTMDYSIAEGSFYEAENDYRILVYYRRTGNRYDEVIGMHNFNINP
jgi:hypothetical protein